MLGLMRDSIWQFVGAALALIAIIVTVVIYLVQRRKKALAYEILTYTPLVTVSEEAKDQIEISFKGRPVADVHLLLMRVWNNGNVQILPGDFVEPLGFCMADGVEILTVEVVKAEPEVLKPELCLQGATLGIRPLLLNGQDSITLKLLVAGGGEKEVARCEGRIAGVRAVMRAEAYEDPGSKRKAIATGILGSVVTIWILATIVLRNSSLSSSWERWLTLGLGIGMGILTVLSWVAYIMMERWKRYRPG